LSTVSEFLKTPKVIVKSAIVIQTSNVKEITEDVDVKGESEDMFVRFIKMLRNIGVNCA
jgi:hypothetical protein